MDASQEGWSEDQAFQMRCRRRIPGVKWYDIVTNDSNWHTIPAWKTCATSFLAAEVTFTPVANLPTSRRTKRGCARGEHCRDRAGHVPAAVLVTTDPSAGAEPATQLWNIVADRRALSLDVPVLDPKIE